MNRLQLLMTTENIILVCGSNQLFFPLNFITLSCSVELKESTREEYKFLISKRVDVKRRRELNVSASLSTLQCENANKKKINLILFKEILNVMLTPQRKTETRLNLRRVMTLKNLYDMMLLSFSYLHTKYFFQGLEFKKNKFIDFK